MSLFSAMTASGIHCRMTVKLTTVLKKQEGLVAAFASPAGLLLQGDWCHVLLPKSPITWNKVPRFVTSCVLK